MFVKNLTNNLKIEFSRTNILNLLKTAIVFLVASLLVWLLFFRSFRTAALMNIADLNREYTKQTELIADSMDNMVKTFGTHVFQSDSCKVLRSHIQHHSNDIIYALRELSEYASSSQFIESINIYDPFLDKVYTTDPRYLSVDGVSPDEITDFDVRDTYNSFDNKSYIKSIFHRNEENGHIDGLYYLFFDTYHMTDPDSCLMILNINPKWYLGNLIEMQPYQRIMLFDNNDRLIYSSIPDIDSVLNAITKEEGDGYTVARMDGRKEIIFLSDFQPLDFKLLTLVDEKECLTHLYTLRHTVTGIFILIGFTLLLSTFIIFLFVYNPYKRMKNKLNIITSENEDGSKLSEDEILTQLIDENATHKIVSDFGNLLEGEIDTLEGFKPPYVLGITAMKDEERLSSLLSAYSVEYVITDYRHTGLVFLSSIRNSVSPVNVDYMVANGCFLAITHRYEDLSSTPVRFRRLCDLFSVRFSLENILTFEEEIDGRSDDMTSAEADLNTLFTSLKNRKSEEAMKAYSDFFDSFVQLDGVSIRHLLKNLEIEIDKQSREQNLDINEALPDVDELLEKASSMKDLEDTYLPYIIQIEESYKMKKKASDSRIAIQIENILDSNYRRNDFTTIELSEIIGKNLNYLSKVYKDTYGISITNSIMKKRAETAKTLLLTTDANVEDIAIKLGFENVKYFYVIFKKYVGITPLQYRKQKEA